MTLLCHRGAAILPHGRCVASLHGAVLVSDGSVLSYFVARGCGQGCVGTFDGGGEDVAFCI